MSTYRKIFLTEIKQARWHFFLVSLLSLLLGLNSQLALKAESRIRSLSSHVKWNADLAILPKGITLEDLRREIAEGKTTDFLPEALFDTTVSIAAGQFHLGAVLPISDSNGQRVMLKGEPLGIDWLRGQIKTSTWEDQSVYATPEWKNKVIAAFFAEGPPTAMENLKQLIDKKTVAQAIFIKTQTERDEAFQAQLDKALWTFLAVLGLFSLTCFAIIAAWFKNRIENTLNVLIELGFTKGAVDRIIVSFAVSFVMLPAIAGFILGLAYNF